MHKYTSVSCGSECFLKSLVFGTAFDREPRFKTENLIKYRIQCRHYGGACVCVYVCVCVCVGRGGYNRRLCHPNLGDSKFVVLLKTVLTFNHKTNNVIVSKIYHTLLNKIVCC